MESQNFWKKCSVCKSPIGLGAKYYVCSVSTCNGQRTGYSFCKYNCFEAHLPGARHRDAGAIEQVAPRTPAAPTSNAPTVISNERAPERKIVTAKPSVSGATSSAMAQTPKEILIVASRLKEYIDARAGFNTSGNVLDILSDAVRNLCDRAIDNARADGRKTVMDRDFKR